MSNKKHMQPFIKNPVTLEATTMYKVLMDTCPKTSIPQRNNKLRNLDIELYI
jgi:hypothetical protein